MVHESNPLRTTRVPTRTFQLRRIHELARQAGYDTREGKRERYEAMLEGLIGRASTRQATRSEREAVIDHLRRQTDAGYRMANARAVEAVSDDDALAVLS